ncbi:MAG: hypothetical protein U0704_10445 [Candidatus Eisenbacteria bacterium]
MRVRSLLVAGAVLVFASLPPSSLMPPAAAATAPADVVFRIRPLQKYQYYAFSYDTVQWAAWNEEGSTLAGMAAHDTLQLSGLTSAYLAFQADSGTFAAQLAAAIDESLRTGAFHLLANQIELSVYVRGAAGTPWWCVQRSTGLADASRLGGLPGTLAPLNGTASARFLDSLAYVPNGGVDSARVDDAVWLSGTTTGSPIVVQGESYTLARRLTLATPVQTTQAVCVLGCMAAAADFHARAAGDVTVEMFVGASPLDAPPAGPAHDLALAVPANPVRGDATFAFAVPAGRPARLEVFDVRGRRVAVLFEGPGDAAARQATWRGAGAPAGVYFARLASGREGRTVRFVRVP